MVKKKKKGLFSPEDIENLQKVVSTKVNELAVDLSTIIIEGTRDVAKDGLKKFFNKGKRNEGEKKETSK